MFHRLSSIGKPKYRPLPELPEDSATRPPTPSTKETATVQTFHALRKKGKKAKEKAEAQVTQRRVRFDDEQPIRTPRQETKQSAMKTQISQLQKDGKIDSFVAKICLKLELHRPQWKIEPEDIKNICEEHWKIEGKKIGEMHLREKLLSIFYDRHGRKVPEKQLDKANHCLKILLVDKLHGFDLDVSIEDALKSCGRIAGFDPFVEEEEKVDA